MPNEANENPNPAVPLEQLEEIQRVNWFTRGLPIEVYEYALAASKRHPSLTSINSQLLDMLIWGYKHRQKLDRDAVHQRGLELERMQQEVARINAQAQQISAEVRVASRKQPPRKLQPRNAIPDTTAHHLGDDDDPGEE